MDAQLWGTTWRIGVIRLNGSVVLLSRVGVQIMKVSLRKCFGVQAACLCLWPILAFAQSSDLSQNLADCKAGRDTCDRSRLSQSEVSRPALHAARFCER